MASSFGLIVGVIDVAMNQNAVSAESDGMENSPKYDMVQKNSKGTQTESHQLDSDSNLDPTLESIKAFVYLDHLGKFETVLKIIGEIPERWEPLFARATQLIKKYGFTNLQAEGVKYAASLEPEKALKISQVVVFSVIEKHKPEVAEKLPYGYLETLLKTCQDEILLIERYIKRDEKNKHLLPPYFIPVEIGFFEDCIKRQENKIRCGLEEIVKNFGIIQKATASTISVAGITSATLKTSVREALKQHEKTEVLVADNSRLFKQIDEALRNISNAYEKLRYMNPNVLPFFKETVKQLEHRKDELLAAIPDYF